MSLDLNTLHKDMLASISNRYQKTTGFPAYDFTLAFALAVLSLDQDLLLAEAHLDVDNLTGIDLDEYIKQHRGLTRKYATYAEATLRVTVGGGDIHAGDLFSTASGVEFYAIEDGTYQVGDTFKVRAYVAGESGNVEAGEIVYMPITLAGIAGVINDAPSEGGLESESDQAFRDRFYDDLQNPNNGCNQQAYVQWALSVAGVGRVRIFPQALGANTVEVCIVDANMEPAASSIIQEVQTLIDPNNNGDGAGEAPIGAVCTVTTAAALSISVSASVTPFDGYDLSAVTENIRTELTAYLRRIAFKEFPYLSYAQVGRRIASAEGVMDYSGLLMNGGTINVPLGDRQTPVLGEVAVT